MNSKQIAKYLRFARLSLGGAVLGVACAGVISAVLGAPDKSAFDVIGALIGGAGSAIAVKIAHIV